MTISFVMWIPYRSEGRFGLLRSFANKHIHASLSASSGHSLTNTYTIPNEHEDQRHDTYTSPNEHEDQFHGHITWPGIYIPSRRLTKTKTKSQTKNTYAFPNEGEDQFHLHICLYLAWHIHSFTKMRTKFYEPTTWRSLKFFHDHSCVRPILLCWKRLYLWFVRTVNISTLISGSTWGYLSTRASSSCIYVFAVSTCHSCVRSI